MIGSRTKPMINIQRYTEIPSNTENNTAYKKLFIKLHFAISHQQKNAPIGPKKNEIINAINPDEPLSTLITVFSLIESPLSIFYKTLHISKHKQITHCK